MKKGNSKFKLLEHRADLKLQLSGRTKEELFRNGLLALSENLRPELEKQRAETKRVLRVKSIDSPSLLVDFLSEALYLSQVNKEIYTGAIFKKFKDTEIEAELTAQKVQGFGQDIKAVTYHNLALSQKNDKAWQAIILFDV